LKVFFIFIFYLPGNTTVIGRFRTRLGVTDFQVFRLIFWLLHS